MPRKPSFKGPRGLFLRLLLPSSFLLLGGPVHAEPALIELMMNRPPSVAVNTIEIHGVITETDDTLLPWSRRISPVAIRYPGIDLASAFFQDKAKTAPQPFNQWLAKQWIEKNAICNNIFQTDPRRAGYFSAPNSTQQCSDLNRPAKDLIPLCETPTTSVQAPGLMRVQWLCKLAQTSPPEVYTEVIASEDPNVPLVNPASKELKNHQNDSEPSK